MPKLLTERRARFLIDVARSYAHVEEDATAIDVLLQAETIAPILVPTFEFGKDSPIGGFGNALLAKLPILAIQQRQLVWP